MGPPARRIYVTILDTAVLGVRQFTDWSYDCVMFQALPYVGMLIGLLFFIYAVIGMQVRLVRKNVFLFIEVYFDRATGCFSWASEHVFGFGFWAPDQVASVCIFNLYIMFIL